MGINIELLRCQGRLRRKYGTNYQETQRYQQAMNNLFNPDLSKLIAYSLAWVNSLPAIPPRRKESKLETA